MSGDLDTLLAQFLRERKYLRNLRPQTLEWYETAWKAFRKSATHCLTDPSALNRAHLEQFVYSLRDRGVRPVTCNTWLRALNAFCRWLHENGHAPTRVHMRPLKVEKRLVETLDAAALRAIVHFKPPMAVTVNRHHQDGPRKGQKNFAWWRIHTLACALLDTGCRVQELLDARVEDFDMDDLLVTVVGKGDKQRRIPFSIDLRRILFRYLQQRERFGVPSREPFMFPAHSGSAWDQRNALRSFYDLQKKLRLPRVGFHRLRHTFATEYLRRGGDVVRLSRTLAETTREAPARPALSDDGDAASSPGAFPEAKEELVFGTFNDDFFVVPRSLAEERARVNRAVFSAQSWGALLDQVSELSVEFLCELLGEEVEDFDLDAAVNLEGLAEAS